MDTDKEIEGLYKQIWWSEMQFKARELYLLRRIETLEKELARINSNQNEFGDK
jgi:hypothetical protein